MVNFNIALFSIGQDTAAALLPEVTLFVGLILLLVVPNLGNATFRLPFTSRRIPCFFGGQRFRLTSHPAVPGVISVMVLLFAAIFALLSQMGEVSPVFGPASHINEITTRGGDPLFTINAFSRLLEMIAYSALLIAAIASLNTIPPTDPSEIPRTERGSPRAERERIQSMIDNRRQVDLHVLLILAAIGMSVVALASDLFVFFLGLELASLSTYILVAFRKETKEGTEGGAKYFIVGAVASAVTLYGISLLYIWAGDLNFMTLREHWKDGPVDAIAIIGVLMILGGLGFKVSAAPFHFAAPDAYAGASAPIAGVLATASMALGFVGVSRLLIGVALPVDATTGAAWLLAVALLAVVTMTWGNLAALDSKNPKRMLAYSSVAHAGYMLAAIAAVGATRTAGADVLSTEAQLIMTAVLFHLAVLVSFKIGAFLVVALMEIQGRGYSLDDFKGLARKEPMIGVAMFVFMLALAGIPPLSGFVSKMLMVLGIVQIGTSDAILTDTAITMAISGLNWVFWLALAVFVNSALSLFYYLRVGVIMFHDPAENDTRLPKASALRLVILVCMVGTIIIGIFPNVLLEFAETAASQFLG